MAGHVLDSALKASRQRLSVVSEGALAASDPSVTVKDVSLATVVTAGKYASVLPKVVRNVDLFRLQMTRGYASKVDYGGEILDILRTVHDKVGAIAPGAQPALMEAVTDFFRQVNIAMQEPGKTELKNICVASGVRMAGSLRDASMQCYKQMSVAQTRISAELDNVNRAIKDLAHVNFDIAQEHNLGHDVSILMDKRDSLVSEISTVISLDEPRYAHDGSVLLSSSGHILVQKEECASFVFVAKDEASVAAGAGLGVISIQKLAYNGRDIADTPKVIDERVFYDPASPINLRLGRLKGLIDVHQVHLPAYIGCLDAMAANVAEQVNRVHNSGSPYPGRSEIVGGAKTTLSSKAMWGGYATIAAVDAATGDVAGVDDFPASALKLDLGGLSRVSEGGVVTTAMILDEINSHFAAKTGDAIGMGQQGLSDKFLLHDISMVVSRCDDKQIRFDFEGLNTSDFGADLEILSVGLPAGASSLGDLPDMARIERGSKTRTFQTIVIEKGALAGDQEIEVKFRVRGDNGVVKEGVVKFTVNFDGVIKPCSRISPELPAAGQGDFAVRAYSGAKYMSASLVDSSGDEIRDPYKEGYIKISSSNKSYNIVMQDDTSQTSLWLDGFSAIKRGLGHFYGLNNFFSTTEKSGRYALDMSVRGDIEADPAMFSNTRLVAPGEGTVNLSHGSAAASATIALNSAVNFANGDSITIHGKTFTFGPVGVVAGVNFDEGFTNLLAAIVSDRDLKNLVKCERVGDNLVITALKAGVSGNNIAYNSTLQGGVAGIQNLANGADIEEPMSLSGLGLRTVVGFSDLYADMVRIDKAAQFMPNKYVSYASGGSITVFAMMSCNIMAGKYESVESDYKTSKSVLEKVVTEYKHDFGFDDNKQAAHMTEIANLMRYLTHARAAVLEMEKEVVRILTR